MPGLNKSLERTKSGDDVRIEFSYHGKTFVLSAAEGDYVAERVHADGTFYEVDLLEDMGLMSLPAGALAVDVGANLGNHTLYFAGVLDLKVVAVEPEQQNASFLRGNLEDNGLSAQVEIVQCALGEHDGHAALVQQIPGNSGTFTVVSEPAGPVEIRTLDEIVEGREVALIKIDVEGQEVQVLRGAEKTLETYHPVVSTECHSSEHFAAISSVLTPLGYSVVDIAGRSDNFIWIHEQALGAQRSKNIRNGIELRRQRRLFRQVYVATDRISNLVRGASQEGAAWRKELEKSLATLNESMAKSNDVMERSDLSVYWKALVDMMGEIRVALLRGMGRELEDRARFDETIAKLERVINEKREHLDASMLRLERALERGHLEQSVERLERAVVDGHGALGEVRSMLAKRDTALASRELDINDLTRKLLSSQEQLRTLTAESVQAQADRQQLLASIQEAKRSASAQTLAVREWEHAYGILHGSRALQIARAVRSVAGRSQAAHDASARSREISETVARLVRTVGMDQPEMPLMGLREVSNSRVRGRETIRAGVATMPGRESGLAIVLDSICPQVDEVYVYLNGFEKAPDCVLAHDNVRAFIGPDIGDRGKFRFIDGYSGYFISIDDDIAYPKFYVQSLIDGIERYSRKAAVGWHGSILLDGFTDYYDPKSRRVLTFGSDRGADTQVHVLGTGCTAFHSDTLKISFGDFLKPNMADIFFALEGQRQNVPFMVLSHRKGWAKPIEFTNSPSISGESMKSSGSRIDVRAITNSLVKTQGKWHMPDLAASYTRSPFTLALIGRTDKDRWKKGGILKSSHLTQMMLDPYGVVTHLIDIEKGDIENLGGANPQVIMIYPGDPDRPDYAKVEYLVDYHASRGRIVLVNLSLNSVARRNDFVCQRIAEWRKVHGEKVWLMTFTDRAKDLHALAPVADAIFSVPKTIEVPDLRTRSFARTEGIFLGDYGKLCDDQLLGFPVEKALAALRAAMPDVPLYAVKQYSPKVSKDLGIRLLPYLSEDYAATLRSARVMVNLVKYATFEMVPAELAAMGVPIVHPRMSFSLSDYLGLSAFEVEDISELVETTALLYKDPMVWQAASASSELRGCSADFRLLSGQLYVRLLRLIRGASSP